MTLKRGLTLFLIAAVISFIFGKKFLFVNESPKEIVPVIVLHSSSSPVQPTLSKKELTCMSDMAYFEARGEGVNGITAVIHVALNRKDNPDFPKDICGVIYQKIDAVCQYSWVCERRSKTSVAFRKTKEYEEIMLLAKTISSIPDRSMVDPTRGSLYYKKIGVKSDFFSQKLVLRVAIGQHRFYREA